MLRAKGPLATWALRVPPRSHIYTRLNSTSIPLRSTSNARSTSSIQSGHIKLDENEGVIYINSE